MSNPSYFTRLAPAPRSPGDPPVLTPPRARFRESPLPVDIPFMEERLPRRPPLPDARTTAESAQPEPVAPAAPTPRAPRADPMETAPIVRRDVRHQPQLAAADSSRPATRAAPAAPVDPVSRSVPSDDRSPRPVANPPRAAASTRPVDANELIAPVPAITRRWDAARPEPNARLWIGTMEVKVTQAKPASKPMPAVRAAPSRPRAARERIARPFSSFGLRQS
jgi:hypothetical protein